MNNLNPWLAREKSAYLGLAGEEGSTRIGRSLGGDRMPLSFPQC
jgi:hypothetical protein